MIIRCEHPISHRGPYNHFDSPEELYNVFPWVLDQNDIYLRHPLPSMDISNCPEKLHLECGFLNQGQMFNWFTTPQREDIINYGMNFYFFKPVGEVYRGSHQCLFDRKHSELVRALTKEEIGL